MSSAADLRLTLVGDADEVALRAIEELASVVEARRAEGARALVALSGGSTPERLFRRLAGSERERIDWRAVELFFSDERGVPPDDPASNFRTARELLFDPLGFPPERVHRMEGEASDLSAAARRYEAELRAAAPSGGSGIPRLDLIWLGMGADGHTASLFPGSSALEEESAAVAASESPVEPTARLTLTLPVIRAARRVQFLVTGASKAERVAEVISSIRARARTESGRPPSLPRGPALPAARAVPLDGRLEWVLDRSAARAIDR